MYDTWSFIDYWFVFLFCCNTDQLIMTLTLEIWKFYNWNKYKKFLQMENCNFFYLRFLFYFFFCWNTDQLILRIWETLLELRTGQFCYARWIQSFNIYGVIYVIILFFCSLDLLPVLTCDSIRHYIVTSNSLFLVNFAIGVFTVENVF